MSTLHAASTLGALPDGHIKAPHDRLDAGKVFLVLRRDVKQVQCPATPRTRRGKRGRVGRIDAGGNRAPCPAPIPAAGPSPRLPTAALGPILGERRGLPEPGPSRGRELLLQPLVLPLQPIVRTLQPIILTSQLIVLTSQLIMLTLHLIPFPGRARRDLLQPRDLFVVVALPFGPLVVDGMRAFIGHARFMADSRQKYKYKIVISTDSPAKPAEIREKAALIQAVHLRGMTLEAFLGLERDPEIDEKLRARESELEAVRQAEPIRTRAALSALTMPVLPVGIPELLGRTVEGIAEDAEAQVTAQIKAHSMHDHGQAWLSEGVGYVRDDRCPFCNQALAPATVLIGAYRAFFSHGYSELRGAIAAMRTSLDDALGDRQLASFERTVEQNVAGVEFWSRFCEIVAPVSLDVAGDRLRTLRNAAASLLNRKAAAPLEAVALDDAFTDAAAQFATLTAAATAYNGAVAAANALIAARKAATGKADIRTIEATLDKLRLTKKRYEPEVTTACEEYQAALKAKAKIEEQKAAAKDKLDKHTKMFLRVSRVLEIPSVLETGAP